MPVMLIAGALDPKYAEIVTTMAQKIPKAIVRIIPNAGHNVHLEQPVPFAELVATFLTGI
jgi:2-succinyl-6-hydroxy-2,4-cyclohexadiene-1-carboxylate synthase